MNYKKTIERKGLKITWVANQIGVSQPLLSLFLHGKRTLQDDKVRALDRLLK